MTPYIQAAQTGAEGSGAWLLRACAEGVRHVEKAMVGAVTLSRIVTENNNASSLVRRRMESATILRYIAIKYFLLIPSMPQPTPQLALSVHRIFRHLKWAVAGLLFISAGLVLWQRYGMEQVVRLSDHLLLEYFAEGNQAKVTHRRAGNGHVLDCTVPAGLESGGCGTLTFKLPDDQRLNLERFSEMRVALSHTGQKPVRLHLRFFNREDGFYQAHDWRTSKPVETTITEMPADGQVMRIPMKWFAVASWWRENTKPPMAHSYTRLDGVIGMQITPAIAPGSSVLHVEAVSLHGKWIDETSLFAILTGLWIGFVILALALAALALRRDLTLTQAKVGLLSEVNRALQLEAEELVGQAHTDPLTGALNRQGLRAALMQTSMLMNEPMAIIFTDIDHFKRINDTHGHDVGDQVLREFVRLLTSGTRAADRVVRWGGEEFLIVCPATDLGQGAALAEKLRARLKEHAWPGNLAVTASFGVARHREQEDIGLVIQRADAMLYEAKRQGRDRVRVFEMAAGEPCVPALKALAAETAAIH